MINFWTTKENAETWAKLNEQYKIWTINGNQQIQDLLDNNLKELIQLEKIQKEIDEEKKNDNESNGDAGPLD
jgi:hypothetical protein